MPVSPSVWLLYSLLQVYARWQGSLDEAYGRKSARKVTVRCFIWHVLLLLILEKNSILFVVP